MKKNQIMLQNFRSLALRTMHQLKVPGKEYYLIIQKLIQVSKTQFRACVGLDVSDEKSRKSP